MNLTTSTPQAAADEIEKRMAKSLAGPQRQSPEEQAKWKKDYEEKQKMYQEQEKVVKIARKYNHTGYSSGTTGGKLGLYISFDTPEEARSFVAEAKSLPGVARTQVQDRGSNGSATVNVYLKY